MKTVPHCLICETQAMLRAFSRAFDNAGNSIAAKIAMMAMTTSNSIRVNPAIPHWRARAVPYRAEPGSPAR